MSVWSGKTLGNVIVGDLIARGGMAEVYRGTHTTLRRDVAVKIMRDHVEDDPETRARFDREARVIARLDHPNIIKIHDYSLLDGRPCLIMDLVPGASLGSYLKSLQKRGESLPYDVIAGLLTSIASAIDHAHKQNIVHRDIKPANILLRSKNFDIDPESPLPADVEPVLTDFGLVRLLDSNTQTSTGTVSGTPSYMSPEQARGDRVDRKTDIYSLGVVLYEMLAGAVPFDAESSFGVLMKHLNEPPPPIPNISPAMQAVINRALAKNPAHRFESTGAFADEFNAALEGRNLSEETLKISEIVSNPQPSSTSRIPFIVGGLAVLTIITLLGYWLFLPRFTTPPLDPNQPVGTVTFLDFNDAMDKAFISVNGLPPPAEGTHYEAWFLSQGSQNRRNLGVIAYENGSGSLTYIDPRGVNLLSQFDRFEITVEKDNDSNPSLPGREVAASASFPPLSLNNIRHVLVAMGTTPGGIALIHGLWNAADNIDTSVLELDDAFDGGDEETLRLKIEEVINQLAGNRNRELYKDWNSDGQIDDPVEGFGLLKNGVPDIGTEQGYLPLTLKYAGLATAASDAPASLADNQDLLAACITGMQTSGEELLALAVQLQKMPLDSGMEEVIAEMLALSSDLLYGVDENANGRIEPIQEECGADTAYETAYLLSQMTIFPGAGNLPK